MKDPLCLVSFSQPGMAQTTALAQRLARNLNFCISQVMNNKIADQTADAQAGLRHSCMPATKLDFLAMIEANIKENI